MNVLVSLRAFTGEDAPLVIAGLILVLIGLAIIVPSWIDRYRREQRRIDAMVADALGQSESPADLNVRYLGGRGTSANR